MTIAVDVGGTFTDIISMDENGNLQYYKLSTTPKNPEIGIYQGIKKLGIKTSEIIHATTIATNSLLGQVNLDLPKVVLLTTKGFRDVIEIGRQNRPELYNPYFEKPRVLIPREFRYEVSERVDANGNEIIKLDEEEAENKIKEGSKKATSIAIVFLHSYLDPLHEKIAKNIALKYSKYVSISSEVAPEPREYERTSTTVINALLMPIVSRYLESLEGLLKEFGNPKLYIMSSSGGLIDSKEASYKPVQIIESGPAAGVVGVLALSKIFDIKNAISFDMGGTTAKAGSIINGEIEITSEYEVGGKTHYGRVVKGSGYPVRFPFIDLAEVSAGGGTIIWRDEAGALRIGPLSAGADPGPMSYNKGGDKPTLTDASLVLGRINEKLLSGEMTLRKDLAIEGLKKLGNEEDVAENALKLANLEMGRAIRLVTVERGLDPSEFTLFAFGGAGPQFALDVAEELGIKEVVIPPAPGLFSAMGMFFADKKFEARKSYPTDLFRDYEYLEKELLNKLGKVDYFIRYADVRYEGQGWELTVQVTDPSKIREDFENKHFSVYGFKLDKPIEIVTIRVFAVVTSTKPKIPDPPKTLNPKMYYRKVKFDDWINTPVYVRETLPFGFHVEGPAIIEEYSSTTIINPGWSASIGKMGSISLRCEKCGK
jgi:N-methylhydantoinase A